MLTHGYRLVANANTADADFYPSLIGLDPSLNPKGDDNRIASTRTDTYFEQFEVPECEIVSITMTRWVNYEDASDPILGVKTTRGSFYTTFSEVREAAIEQGELVLLERLQAMPTLPRHLKDTLQ